MVNVTTLQRYLPLSVKHALKPYYRLLYPDKLHVLLWITFRCNYRCSYCPIVTKFSYEGVIGRREECSVDEWLEGLDKLPSANIYVSGGEPFLYNGLPELINRLPDKHRILGIVTNGTVKTEVYRRLQKPVHLNISFHREFVDDKRFLRKLHELKEDFRLCVNIVATPENIPILRKVRDMLNHKNITLHVDPLDSQDFTYSDADLEVLGEFLERDRFAKVEESLNFKDYTTKSCSAGMNYVNILPNGDVYTCMEGVHYNHSPLYQPLLQSGPAAPYSASPYRMKNLFDEDFSLRKNRMVCRLPCASGCDLDSASIKRVGPIAAAA